MMRAGNDGARRGLQVEYAVAVVDGIARDNFLDEGDEEPEDVRETVDEGKKRLGREGRVVVRVSGTEPLIRVMCEGADMNEIQAVAQGIADIVKQRLGGE